MLPEEMFTWMPHRGRNVLIDRYEDTGPASGMGWLTVAGGDPLGRDVFIVNGPSGPRYSPFFLVEHVALTSLLIVRHEMGRGRLAYFSTVSKFRRHGDAAPGTPLVSRVSRGRDRADFRAFNGEVLTEGGARLLEVDIMAFLAPRGSLPAAAPARDDGFPRAEPMAFPGLPPALVFLGGPDLDRAVFPHDHPLAEGHFPGSPTMMGMAQWLCVAERAAVLAPAGTSEMRGSGTVLTPDGRPVAEVNGLVVSVTKSPDGRVLDFEPLETKRVTFRERIMAGDGYVAGFAPGA
jgi:3-hydroxymyristoyl/3-hydroxydecanoyl-(acyl carrier protein) dehydratase